MCYNRPQLLARSGVSASSRARAASKIGLRPGVRCAVDFVTVTVLVVIVISYTVGSLTSSVETETQLPHRYR